MRPARRSSPGWKRRWWTRLGPSPLASSEWPWLTGRTVVDAEQSAREAEERYARQGLHVSPTFEGMVRVDGNLDPECGQTVITAGRAGRRCDLDEGGGSPRRPVAWPETPRWPGSSPGEDRSRSTWAAGPRRCRRGAAGARGGEASTAEFPGCDRPQSWCDAHDVRHWADGGGTSTTLVLLCRPHHRAMHGEFRVGMVD